MLFHGVSGTQKDQNLFKRSLKKAEQSKLGALAGELDKATNRGFPVKDNSIWTYEQKKLGLSSYCEKRWVLKDGIHTEPIEYHIKAQQ